MGTNKRNLGNTEIIPSKPKKLFLEKKPETKNSFF
jgi:hypothetical protein